MASIDWNLIKSRLKEAIFILPHFLRNPVGTMRQLPDWDWPTVLILHGGLAAACGILSGVVERRIGRIFSGLIVAPVSSTVLMFLACGFFYYLIFFGLRREMDFRKLYVALAFACIPLLVLNIGVSLVPPMPLMGLACAAYLLFVALTSQFQLPVMETKKVLIGLFAIYAVFFLFQVVSVTKRMDQMREKATPESLDILEKELKFENE